MPSQRLVIRTIAGAFTTGKDDPEALFQRLTELFGGKLPKWVLSMTERLHGFMRAQPRRPEVAEICHWLREDPGFIRAWGRGKVDVQLYVPLEEAMRPALCPDDGEIPALCTVPELADLLRLDPLDLGWLTARKDYGHYTYRWLKKRSSPESRLIEIPKPILKQAQRRVLDRILSEIPVHESAHGFRPQHSIHTFLEPHFSQKLVLKMDLENFFTTVQAARVRRIFLTAGYPEAIAVLLTRLCAHATPEPVLGQMPGRKDWVKAAQLRFPHLPQGAPCSPALANLAAFRMDCRLHGLARSFGACYTRYADDMLFSGDDRFSKLGDDFYEIVNTIIAEEGFRLAFRKTRFLRASQRQKAAGVILNERPNLDRREYDQLKAILTNCSRQGLASQNREDHPEFLAHLRGRVDWVRSLNPQRAEKLERLLEQISPE